MRVATLGKRAYAFELKWVDVTDVEPREFVRDELGEGVSGVYHVTKGEVTSVIGFAAGSVKGRVRAYAAALASAGTDGIYAAQTDDKVWYVVIAEGKVVQATDRSVAADAALEILSSLAQTFPELALYADQSLVDDLPGALLFDPVQAVRKSKVTPLRAVGSSTELLGVVALLVVVCGIAYGGWYLFIRKPEVKLDAAAQAALARDNYVTQVQAQLAEMPTDGAWLEVALESAVAHYPPYLAGWGLDTVTCSPSACTGSYVLPADATSFAVSPFIDLYGPVAVRVAEDQRSVNVALELGQSTGALTAEQILSPAKAPMRYLDVAGRMRLLFPDIKVESPVLTDLKASNGGPADVAPLLQEQTATGGDAYLDAYTLREQIDVMEAGGFGASSFNFAFGAGITPAAWRIDWVRVSGGDL